MPKKLTHEEAVNRSWLNHPIDKDNYGYLSEYPGRQNNWRIYCYQCKEWFLQNAGNHLNGQGCRKCSYDKRRELFSLGLLIFSKKANEKHTDKYKYHKGIYINSFTKIEIICKKHGSFWQQPHDHLNGSGCPDCAREKQHQPIIPISKVLKEAKKIHLNKYGYSWIDIINYSRKSDVVPIICPKHGIFYQSLEIHLKGSGCPSCANHGFDPTKPAILYYVKDILAGLYKIGITNNSLEKRFEGKIKKLKIIKTWDYTIGLDARDQEKRLHQKYKEYRLINENWVTKRGSNGATEFFDRDILNLDNDIITETKEYK